MSWARIVGIERRNKSFLTLPVPKILVVGADISRDPFEQMFEGRDVVSVKALEDLGEVVLSHVIDFLEVGVGLFFEGEVLFSLVLRIFRFREIAGFFKVSHRHRDIAFGKMEKANDVGRGIQSFFVAEKRENRPFQSGEILVF